MAGREPNSSEVTPRLVLVLVLILILILVLILARRARDPFFSTTKTFLRLALAPHAMKL